MLLKFITKGRYNRENCSEPWNYRNSIIFHIHGDTSGSSKWYEYQFAQINSSTFNIKCVSCKRYLTLQNLGITVLSISNSARKKYVIDTSVSEDELLQITSYSGEWTSGENFVPKCRHNIIINQSRLPYKTLILCYK